MSEEIKKLDINHDNLKSLDLNDLKNLENSSKEWIDMFDQKVGKTLNQPIIEDILNSILNSSIDDIWTKKEDLLSLLKKLISYDKHDTKTINIDPSLYKKVFLKINQVDTEVMFNNAIDNKNNAKQQFESDYKIYSEFNNFCNEYFLLYSRLDSNKGDLSLEQTLKNAFVVNFKKDYSDFNWNSLLNRLNNSLKDKELENFKSILENILWLKNPKDIIKNLEELKKYYDKAIKIPEEKYKQSQLSFDKINQEIQTKIGQADLWMDINNLSEGQSKENIIDAGIRKDQAIGLMRQYLLDDQTMSQVPRYAQNRFKAILEQSLKEIKDIDDWLLEPVLQQKIEEAQKLFSTNNHLSSAKNHLLSNLNIIKNQLNIKTVVDNVESYQWITIDQYLGATNEDLSFLRESPQYRDVFNQVFDMLYRDKDSFKDNPEQYKTFLKIIWANEKDEIDFYIVDKNNENLDPALRFYPRNTRVVRIVDGSENGEVHYITFWKNLDDQKLLVEWFQENKEDIENVLKNDENIGKLFQIVKDKKEFLQFQWRLEISAYGWPDALSVLFDNQKDWKKPFVEYLKKDENLRGVLDSFGKIENGKNVVDIETQWQYFVKMFEWIKQDPVLLNKYSKLLIEQWWDKYFWPASNITSRKTIVESFMKLDMFKWYVPSVLAQKDSIKKPNQDLFDLLVNQKILLDKSVNTATWKQGMVEQAKNYISVLFNNPIGQMIVGLLDSVLWGKGWLMKYLWGEKSWFGKELNKQFKDQYALEKDQLEILDNISKTKPKSFFGIKPENYQSELNNFVNNQIRKDNIYVNEIENQFNWENTKNLDVNLIERYFKANQKDKFWDINYIDIFEMKENKLSIKSGADVSPILQEILKDENEIAKILEANHKIITEKWYFGKDVWHKAISSDRDYMVFAAAYLMWWSKWQWNFHYVISESDMPNEIIQYSTENLDIKQQQDDFTKIIAFEWDADKESKNQLLIDYPKKTLDLTKEPDKTNYPKYQKLIVDFYETNFTNKEKESYKYLFSLSALDIHKQFFAKHIDAYIQFLKEEMENLKKNLKNTPNDIKTFNDKFAAFSWLVAAVINDNDGKLKMKEIGIINT